MKNKIQHYSAHDLYILNRSIYNKNNEKSLKQKIKDFLKNRTYNTKEWSINIIGLPIGYIWLFPSFFLNNPLLYASKRKSYKESLENNNNSLNKFASNFAMIAEGTFTLLTCGCFCCGCCTTFSPEDIYES